MKFGKGFKLNESGIDLNQIQSNSSNNASDQNHSNRLMGSSERLSLKPSSKLQNQFDFQESQQSFSLPKKRVQFRQFEDNQIQDRHHHAQQPKNKFNTKRKLFRRFIIFVIIFIGLISALMVICEGYYFIRLGIRMFSYSVQATRTSIQDPNISNFVSLIEVDRYFITDNQTPTYATVNTGGRASYLIAQLAGTCSLTNTSVVQLFETQNDADYYLSLVKGSFPIFTITYTILLMIAFWVAGFILAPRIKYHHIPPFLRRGTRLQNLHGLILIAYFGMIVLDGTLMPLHFINLSESCIIGTDRDRISAQGSLSNFFAMQVLLLFVTIPLILMIVCKKISQTFTLLAMVLLYVSMLFVVYLTFASYYFLWLVGLQNYSFLQSILFLIVVCVPLVYILVGIIYVSILFGRWMCKNIKKKK